MRRATPRSDQQVSSAPAATAQSLPPAPIVDPTTEHRADGPRLHVAAAARRVGVTPSTLRTWDRRYGIGPTGHGPGRHRRYSPDDLARLDLMHRALILGATPADAAAHALTALPPHSDAAQPPPATTERHPDTGTRTADLPTGAGPGQRHPAGTAGNDRLRARTGGTALRLPGAGWRTRSLGRAALALDADTVRGLLAESIAQIGVHATWDDVTRPVLAAVAQRWADTGAGIEIEHLLSDCVTAVFSAVAATAAPVRFRAAGAARRDGRRSAPPSPGRARHDTRTAGRVLPVAGDRPACDSTDDGSPPHRTGRAAAVVPDRVPPPTRRSCGHLPRTRPRISQLRRRPRLGPGGTPTAGRTARASLEEATDALSAAATV